SHRDPFQTLALSEEAEKRKSSEAREHCETERLFFEIIGPARNNFILIGKLPLILLRWHSAYARNKCERECKRQQQGDSQPGRRPTLPWAGAGGVSNARAIRRAPFRMAREELLMVIDARETASTSAPTLNGSRISLPMN